MAFKDQTDALNHFESLLLEIASEEIHPTELISKMIEWGMSRSEVQYSIWHLIGENRLKLTKGKMLVAL